MFFTKDIKIIKNKKFEDISESFKNIFPQDKFFLFYNSLNKALNDFLDPNFDRNSIIFDFAVKEIITDKKIVKYDRLNEILVSFIAKVKETQKLSYIDMSFEIFKDENNILSCEILFYYVVEFKEEQK